MSQRDELALRDYLEHIHQAIGRIQRYLEDIDHAGFLINEEKQDAVIRNLEIIGEAAGNIQRHFPDFAAMHPDFPLKAAYGTRNALSHGYFKVDLDVVWKTVERDLPMLEIQVSELIQSLLTS
ncbi:MAG: DUF86 domain-containing protein [Gammaproteobacteria bacterium]|nr:DUF86 domain-containing protein [Gammaproteobacteria bacterium]MCW8839906.1 DUF86 domain-containing protein [Gammaproteobacteria bacterium]MCW8959096.1 DUF86 domain-containing protein [Gammaproteobacteria bacterium]MCW8972870.1 DUF86 domain-containing protein [Gammaproteobacteria bacterium]MCW8993207.1 DUF86 domain-containing protein [Gammaproteobacteria bacterium]